MTNMSFTEDIQRAPREEATDSGVARHYRSKVEALEAKLAKVRKERDAWQAAYDGLMLKVKGGEIVA